MIIFRRMNWEDQLIIYQNCDSSFCIFCSDRYWIWCCNTPEFPSVQNLVHGIHSYFFQPITIGVGNINRFGISVLYRELNIPCFIESIWKKSTNYYVSKTTVTTRGYRCCKCHPLIFAVCSVSFNIFQKQPPEVFYNKRCS